MRSRGWRCAGGRSETVEVFELGEVFGVARMVRRLEPADQDPQGLDRELLARIDPETARALASIAQELQELRRLRGEGS